MGCCSSNVFHDEEKGLEDHLFPYLDYQEQPDDEYKQLDTENDQKGDTAVEHIFKKTKLSVDLFLISSYLKELKFLKYACICNLVIPLVKDEEVPRMVYGQPPKDMRNSQIDWKHEYHIDFINRPCPYDFPAFEGDKPPDYDENKIATVDGEKSKKESGEEEYEKGARKRKSKSKDKKKKKSEDKYDKKDISKVKKPRRSSNELDQCSLSEKN
ncbi:unnamed protein product [Acanthocheilonema viteae]|uniref:Uncharacterized protein n=1 Tax=Acanthocheilonema viteae TaxID=6277 RepID=A0A498SAA6_ACAVI|nr:unnamed protein product [Acanthocheilonema viteae]